MIIIRGFTALGEKFQLKKRGICFPFNSSLGCCIKLTCNRMGFSCNLCWWQDGWVNRGERGIFSGNFGEFDKYSLFIIIRFDGSFRYYYDGHGLQPLCSFIKSLRFWGNSKIHFWCLCKLTVPESIRILRRFNINRFVGWNRKLIFIFQC